MEDFTIIEQPNDRLSAVEDEADCSPVAPPTPRLSFQDNLEGDLEPAALWASADSLISILAATAVAVSALREHNEDPLLENICAQCERLHHVLSELEQLLATYAKHWTDSNDMLDPMLCHWINDCKANVLKLQEEATRGTEAQAEAETEDWELLSLTESFAEAALEECAPQSPLERCYLEMQGHTAQLEDFMPIMKCDLNDFLSTNIAPAPPSRGCNFALEHIRAALYDLSDTLKSLQPGLERLHTSTPATSLSPPSSPSSPSPRRSSLPTLANATSRRLTGLLATLTEILTNNGSEWIEAMLAGDKMTFGEFAALDCTEIRRLQQVLRRLGRDFERETFTESGMVLLGEYVGEVEGLLGLARGGERDGGGGRENERREGEEKGEVIGDGGLSSMDDVLRELQSARTKFASEREEA